MRPSGASSRSGPNAIGLTLSTGIEVSVDHVLVCAGRTSPTDKLNPAGLAADGLPLGLQIIGRAFDEATVLRVADVLERAARFTYKPSPLAGEGGARRGATGR